MLEQEAASIMRYVLDSAGNPSPYYWKVPENFVVPAAYFPVPEIWTGGETFRTYRMSFVMYIMFFHKTDELAYDLGLQTLSAVKGNRNRIPIIDTDGAETGEYVRLADPALKMVDGGACQMTVEWVSRRPYDSTLVDREKMQRYTVVRIQKGV